MTNKQTDLKRQRVLEQRDNALFSLYLELGLVETGMTREEARGYQATFIQAL